MKDATLVSIALVALLAGIVLPLRYLGVFYQPVVQLVSAVVAVGVLLFISPVAGLVFGLALVAVYFRLYRDSEVLKDWGLGGGGDPRTLGPMARLVSGHITPKHLEDAQNNVVSEEDYKKEMIGIQGVYGEPVYSAQGTDRMMPGYEAPAQLTGTEVDFSSIVSS